jgi:hypothetical protein
VPKRTTSRGLARYPQTLTAKPRGKGKTKDSTGNEGDDKDNSSNGGEETSEASAGALYNRRRGSFQTAPNILNFSLSLGNPSHGIYQLTRSPSTLAGLVRQPQNSPEVRKRRFETESRPQGQGGGCGKPPIRKAQSPGTAIHAKAKRKAVDFPEGTSIDSTMKLIRTRSG